MQRVEIEVAAVHGIEWAWLDKQQVNDVHIVERFRENMDPAGDVPAHAQECRVLDCRSHRSQCHSKVTGRDEGLAEPAACSSVDLSSNLGLGCRP